MPVEIVSLYQDDLLNAAELDAICECDSSTCDCDSSDCMCDREG
jgi:hypothetical protein